MFYYLSCLSVQLNKEEILKSKLVVALWDSDLLSSDDYMSGVSVFLLLSFSSYTFSKEEPCLYNPCWCYPRQNGKTLIETCESNRIFLFAHENKFEYWTSLIKKMYFSS